METIRERWIKKYGYLPSDSEILSMYTSGSMLLSDKEENELITYFKTNLQ